MAQLFLYQIFSLSLFIYHKFDLIASNFRWYGRSNINLITLILLIIIILLVFIFLVESDEKR